ncbi:uncharacterized protein I303_107562 [Kwoniella dejecticola CBS 10117]|uniref:Uncharacterized protein n=1 Tax=Kwoniella dejecticola CBS 10117 TaxID=1296121 RepID=A0A1A5ZV30_9TREE|nr:uncharacterized protein I303_07572 [Kwoniella dejecticola CBS 10117]OBR81662.1 hypothetical protein I303_07572 [Kwoniella dejecticola CBS 10117]
MILSAVPRLLRHRPRTLIPSNPFQQFQRYTHSPPKSQPKHTHTATPDPIEWLPLPRSLAYRKALMLLSIPLPPVHWPSHLDIASPLLATTSAMYKSLGIAVNAIYDGSGTDTTFSNEEVYKARIFWPDGMSKTYERFTMDSVSSEELQNDLAYVPEPFDSNRLAVAVEGDGKGLAKDTKEILVCTHGSRDCRCSDRGGALVYALREEVERRNLGARVKIREIAHVGGHKYAANAILLPTLDMMSNLTLEHAPSLISHILDPRADSQMWNHWRGRYGLTEAQQAELWSKVDPSKTVTSASARTPASLETRAERVELRFKTFEGELRTVNARIGSNLLEVGKENDLPSLEGVCGGNLECATCHLYIPSSPTPPVGEASDEELDMLGYALGYRDGESRLGCQVQVTKELGEWCAAGGVIGLPRF